MRATESSSPLHFVVVVIYIPRIPERLGQITTSTAGNWQNSLTLYADPSTNGLSK